MVDKIDMSLDDIIKSSKSLRVSGGSGRRPQSGGRREGGTPRRGGAQGGPRNTRPSAAAGGGVQRSRNRGGIAKPQQKYTRVTT